jgi:hypothetical protein
MPTFTIKTSDGEYDIEANRAPTPEEAMAAVQKMRAVPGEQLMPAPAAPEGLITKMVRGATGIGPRPTTPSQNSGGEMIPAMGLGPSRNLMAAGDAVANLGIRAAGPTAGQAMGATTGPAAPAMVPILGGIGGMVSEGIAQAAEGTFPKNWVQSLVLASPALSPVLHGQAQPIGC